MTRRLFLTGPIGWGKSTAIQTALGERIAQCGGFLTRRYRAPHLHFTLESPDGNAKETFLDFAAGEPVLTQSVFSSLGTQLLQARRGRCPHRPKAGRGDVGIAPYVMDEIGGIELLNPAFAAALEAVLSSDIPILGVLKGEGPAGALIEKLGLTKEYELAASRLREQLRSDPDTLVYECGQYDKNALRLAGQWAEEYLHE